MLEELPADHEIPHLERAMKYVRVFGCAVDGGAHKGIWTREMMKRFRRVVAFEPFPENYRELPDCHRYMAALGSGKGRASMAPGPENTGQYHVVEGDDVPVVPLDDYGLPVDFLKLDVEGMEYAALMGARETIEKYRPVIVIEETGLCARYGVKDYAARDLLVSWGYTEAERCNKNHIMVP